MTTPADPRPVSSPVQPEIRTVGQLGQEIRLAWLTVAAAIPFPAEIAASHELVEGTDDPRVGAILDARATAFPLALEEIVDGGYQVPVEHIEALRRGVLPGEQPESIRDQLRRQKGGAQ
jgi:hypothetical protein